MHVPGPGNEVVEGGCGGGCGGDSGGGGGDGGGCVGGPFLGPGSCTATTAASCLAPGIVANGRGRPMLPGDTVHGPRSMWWGW